MAGYDRAITIFSPEGKIYQVEYAGEAVKRGWPTVGVKCKGGVVLAAEKRKISALFDPTSLEKIYLVDEHAPQTSNSAFCSLSGFWFWHSLAIRGGVFSCKIF